MPSDEHVQDPRDFYASDSPVLSASPVLTNFDSEQELYKSAEDIEPSNDNEHQGSSIASATRPVRFSGLIVHFITY